MSEDFLREHPPSARTRFHGTAPPKNERFGWARCKCTLNRDFGQKLQRVHATRSFLEAPRGSGPPKFAEGPRETLVFASSRPVQQVLDFPYLFFHTLFENICRGSTRNARFGQFRWYLTIRAGPVGEDFGRGKGAISDAFILHPLSS